MSREFGTMGTLIASAALLALALPAGAASAQPAAELVGAWTIVSNDTVQPDGSRAAVLGPNPLTQLIFTSDGRFSQILLRSDLPKFASGNRATGTPDEYAAVVKGSYAVFGAYSISNKVVTLRVEGSAFPNLTGSTQTRPLVSLTADQLAWTNPVGTTGVRIETVWKRIK